MKKIISGLLLFLLFIPSVSFAATFETKDEVYLDKVVEDDLYVAGEEVRVRTDIRGDLFIAGNELLIDGKITGDVVAGGQKIEIKGLLEDDLKAAGNTITLDSKVTGDVMMAGENLFIENMSEVGGDLLFAGTKAKIEANVDGDIKGTGQSVYLNSQIKGNVWLYNSGPIIFGSKAKIMGNLMYSGSHEIKIPEGIVMGKVTFKEKNIDSKEGLKGVIAELSIYGFVCSLFLGLLMIGFARYFGIHNNNRVMKSPFQSLSIGFLLLFATPIVCILLMITIIGLPVGFIILALYSIFIYVATILGGMLIGRYLIRVDESSHFLKIYGSFALGALIYTLLGIVPFIGWAIKLIIVMMAMGGLVLGNIDRFHELRKKKLL